MQSKNFGSEWTFVERVEFLEKVMSLPGRYGASIAFGVHCHGTDIGLDDLFKMKALTKLQRWELSQWLPHALALEICLDRASRLIRRERGEQAVGSPIYEDLPERRRLINAALQMVRDRSNPRTAKQKEDAEAHRRLMEAHGAHINTAEAIAGNFRFAKKGEDRLLEFADVCAYGLRRWYSKLGHGEAYYKAMGGKAERAPFDAASSSGDIIWSKVMVDWTRVKA